MTNALAIKTDALARLSEAQTRLIKSSVLGAQASDEELALYVEVCHRANIDPFSRSIWVETRKDKHTGELSSIYHLTIDGWRTVAANSGAHSGTRFEFYGTNGEAFPVWVQDKPPVACKCYVTTKTGTHEGFSSYKRDRKKTPSWESYPEEMMAVRAEMRALRRAFPRQAFGMDTNAEPAPMVEALPPEEPEQLNPTAIIEDAQKRDTPAPAHTRAWDEYNSKWNGLRPTDRNRFPPPDAVQEGAIPGLLKSMMRANS